jgi:hypothetical protein
MLKLENAEPITPDAACSLAIAAVAFSVLQDGTAFVLLSASASSFTGRIFEVTEAQIETAQDVLGSGWTVTSGENDELTCEKV